VSGKFFLLYCSGDSFTVLAIRFTGNSFYVSGKFVFTVLVIRLLFWQFVSLAIRFMCLANSFYCSGDSFTVLAIHFFFTSVGVFICLRAFLNMVIMKF
jgi:hypothetical protein